MHRASSLVALETQSAVKTFQIHHFDEVFEEGYLHIPEKYDDPESDMLAEDDYHAADPSDPQAHLDVEQAALCIHAQHSARTGAHRTEFEELEHHCGNAFSLLQLLILVFSNVVIRTSDVIGSKRDVPVGCKQTDEDQLTYEMLEKAENQDNFQELLLASPKTYPDLAAKYEETKCVAAASSMISMRL